VKHIAILTEEGLVLSYYEYLAEGIESSETTILLEDKPENLSSFLKSYYKNNEFKELPEKPSNYHIWNLETEQWQEPENYQQLLFNEAASKVKRERQRLLTATDWTDTVSASTRLENYNEWQSYRQALRDITTQEGYPFNVIWPTQPV
jgi:hypothetical protein